MEGIRIIELPPAAMASSGDRTLEEFETWFSQFEKKSKALMFHRDFMWFDRSKKKRIWCYALPPNVNDTGGFVPFSFNGGLYACAVSRDEDDRDGERVYTGIREWVQETDHLELDERDGHYTMFHVITPDRIHKAIGYRQLDIFVPIKVN